MQDPAVREATASEELTLEEEYEMCESWRVDEDKLTFIVLRRISELSPSDPAFWEKHGVDQMVGDVNIFLSKEYDDEAEEEQTGNAVVREPPRERTRCEVELMIASPSSRRKGYGVSALSQFLPYASKTLGIPPRDFFVRVGADNAASISLFGKVGFSKLKGPNVFGEIEMVYSSDDWKFGEGSGEGSGEYRVVNCPEAES
ncbi:hypothetical protein T439DRAFT_320229 [Meredithblackwellia eburnea MCA 4105]